MTDLSRGARVRRSGRRPGWVLLTALLVLAIGASSALVFTSKVELLKLAVILALWAAVVAAFVSVIYRRQSDVDQARARDLKLVYDLQLDREISARREYELTVESQLRRELATELRAQSGDEVSELRAELAALRTNLEILFDAELSDRPALESDRKRGRVHSDWERDSESARDRINRVSSVRAEEPVRRSDDTIIDVHEEPLVPPPPPPPPQQPRQPAAETYQQAYAPEAYPPSRQNRTPEPPEPDRGSHRRAAEAEAPRNEPAPTGGWTPPAGPVERPQENQGWSPQPPGQPSGWPPPNPTPTTGPQRFEPPPRRSHRRAETPEPQFAPPTSPQPEPVQPPPPQPEPQFAPIPPQPEPPHQPRIPWPPPPAEKRRRQPEQPDASWQPVSPEGQWLPAGQPGSNWTPGPPEGLAPPPSWAYDNGPSRDMPSHRTPSTGEPAEQSLERRGRHSSAPADPSPPQTSEPAAEWGEPGRRARSRHSSDHPDAAAPPAPAMSPPPPPPPPPPTPAPDRGPAMSPPPPANARHRSADEPDEPEEPQSGGQSVADLLARLQTAPSEGGGRRRRRED